ncbi:MAG: hypothetical protein RH948_16045 [Cyclobacteriaceae bacterium]
MSETTDYRALILGAVDDLQASGDAQVKACLDFAERLKNAKEMQPEAFSINRMLSSEVAELPSDVFLETFVWKAKGVDEDSDNKKQTWCFNLVNQLKSLRLIDEETATTLEGYEAEISRLSDKWELGLFKLEKAVNKPSKSEADAEASLQAEITKMWDAWERVEDHARVALTFDKLIDPIKDFVEKELSIKPDHDFAKTLSSLLQGLKDCQLAWQKCSGEHAEIFEALAPKIKQIMQNLATTKALVADNTRPID